MGIENREITVALLTASKLYVGMYLFVYEPILCKFSMMLATTKLYIFSLVRMFVISIQGYRGEWK